MMKKDRIIHVIFSIVIIIFVMSIVHKAFQNDTFFTIALGEKILNGGLNTEEKLVWHQGLEFTNPRWLFDFIIANIYNILGFAGIYGFVILLAVIQGLIYYYILNKITGKKVLSLLFTLITMYFNSNEFAARSQIVSFTLFLLEFFAIEELLKTNKKRYFIILAIIPIIIVNIHATVFPMYFVFYLPYIAEFILSKLKLKTNEDSKIVIERKNIKLLIILIIIGIIEGFCTPKGLEAYTYMFKIMGGLSSSFISELQPVNVFEQVYLTIMLITAIGIIAFTKTKVKVTDCFFIIGFAFMSFSTYRCIFYFYLISTICVIRILNTFLDDNNIKINFISEKNRNIIVVLFIIFIIINSLGNFISELGVEYVDYSKYPGDATNYILNNIDISKMKIYNSFDFGSYLEFKGISAFMDSRSELYTPEFNQGINILEDFLNITMGNENYKTVFDQYGITHALLYSDELINKYICDDNEWTLIYRDTTFSLYERKDFK